MGGPILDQALAALLWGSREIVVRVLICSGSVTSSITAARPLARAWSKAAAKSSVRVTRSAWYAVLGGDAGERCRGLRRERTRW